MNLIEFAKQYDSAMRLQRAGLNQNYGRATRANKKRHGVKEPKKNCKAPDTYWNVMMSNKRCHDKKEAAKTKVYTKSRSINRMNMTLQ